MLAERAIRLVGAGAILTSRGLDVRMRPSTHGVALDPRVRDGHEGRKHELQQDCDPPQSPN